MESRMSHSARSSVTRQPMFPDGVWKLISPVFSAGTFLGSFPVSSVLAPVPSPVGCPVAIVEVALASATHLLLRWTHSPTPYSASQRSRPSSSTSSPDPQAPALSTTARHSRQAPICGILPVKITPRLEQAPALGVTKHDVHKLRPGGAAVRRSKDALNE